jgi:ATP-binding cassette subfamily E protein 1
MIIVFFFQIAQDLEIKGSEKYASFKYPEFTKKLGTFTLKVESGSFANSQITVLLGENGTGKTTFIKILAGRDNEKKEDVI